MKKLCILFFVIVFAKVYSQCIELKSEDSLLFSRIEENLVFLEKLQSSLIKNSAESPLLRNELYFILMEKSKLVLDITEVITEYFLQRRISISDPLREKKLVQVHSLLVLLYQIKTTADLSPFEQIRKELNNLKKAFLSPILKNPSEVKKSEYIPKKIPPLLPRKYSDKE